MNEENFKRVWTTTGDYSPAIHTFATDKIQAKLLNLMFAIEDAKRALKNKMYGGVTEEEQILILRNTQKEQEIYEYILDALDNKND
jgi:hypothetical protein